MLCFDILSKKQPPTKMPAYLTKANPYILEIENETRKYVLAAKSQFDLEEWFTAIYAQIESLKANKFISKNQQTIVAKEVAIASRDLKMVKFFHESRLNVIITNQAVQSKLLEFVNDTFISELLLGITKYMGLIENKDLMPHALDRAKSLFTHMK